MGSKVSSVQAVEPNSALSSAGRLDPAAARPTEGVAQPKPTDLPRPTPERAEAVLAQVRTVLRPGMRRADVELFPRDLGRVQVRLEVNRGEVSAVLRVESAEAMAALQQGSADLRGAFERASLTLSDLRFEFSDPGARGGQDETPGDQRGRSRSSRGQDRATSITSRSVSVPSGRASSASSGIDTLA